MVVWIPCIPRCWFGNWLKVSWLVFLKTPTFGKKKCSDGRNNKYPKKIKMVSYFVSPLWTMGIETFSEWPLMEITKDQNEKWSLVDLVHSFCCCSGTVGFRGNAASDLPTFQKDWWIRAFKLLWGVVFFERPFGARKGGTRFFNSFPKSNVLTGEKWADFRLSL